MAPTLAPTLARTIARVVAALACGASVAAAQGAGSPPPRAGAPPRLHHHAAAALAPHHPVADRPLSPRAYYLRMGLGFASSILFHEAAHVASSYAMGRHPSFGFDRGRPTVYSGIDATVDPHKQLVFSSAGLVAQAALDEAVLDVPHHGRGAPYERGVLLGGLATAFFYVTLGRNANVSDVTYIARTSGWSKTQVSLLVGGVAVLHTVRVARDGHYAHFFTAPDADGRVRVGVRVSDEP